MNETPRRIGYARTSTTEQNLAPQVAALRAAGCAFVRTEQKSGASLTGRPEFATVLDFIHPGETLVVTRIDRLARSLADLQTIVARLRERGAHLAATEQPVDTSTMDRLRTVTLLVDSCKPFTYRRNSRLRRGLDQRRSEPFRHRE